MNRRIAPVGNVVLLLRKSTSIARREGYFSFDGNRNSFENEIQLAVKIGASEYEFKGHTQTDHANSKVVEIYDLGPLDNPEPTTL